MKSPKYNAMDGLVNRQSFVGKYEVIIAVQQLFAFSDELRAVILFSPIYF